VPNLHRPSLAGTAYGTHILYFLCPFWYLLPWDVFCCRLTRRSIFVLEEQGVVKEVTAGGALVVTERKGQCVHCAAQQTCQTLDGYKEVLAEVLNPIGAAVGDRVKIIIEEKILLRSSLLVYFFPAASVIAGSALGYYTGRYLGWDLDLCAIVSGLFFLGVSFLVVSLLSSNPKEMRKHLPQICEIISHRGSDVHGQESMPKWGNVEAQGQDGL